MAALYEPLYTAKGWFDETGTALGWFDPDLATTATGSATGTLTATLGRVPLRSSGSALQRSARFRFRPPGRFVSSAL
jgi:hypothetical protein